MPYRNMEITFTADQGAGYTVTCHTEVGRAGGVFCIPPALMRDAGHLLPESMHRRRQRTILVREESEPEEALDEEGVGRLLYQALMTPALAALITRLGEARVRLILVVPGHAEPERAARLSLLHQLPWELLHDGEGFLTLMHRFSIVRMVDGWVPQPRKLSTALKVLVVAADPDLPGLEKLKLDVEADILKRKASRRLHMHFLQKAERTHLAEVLAQGFHVVHFMGHGICTDQGAGVVLGDGRGGAEALDAESLVRFLSNGLPRHKRPQLVVLNVCEGSAVFHEYGECHSMAADLTRGGIAAVVAMRRAVLDDAALAYCRGFYGRLARRVSVDEAMQQGRAAVANDPASRVDWSVPVLFSHLPDGRLYAPRGGRLLRGLAAAAAMVFLCWALYAGGRRVHLDTGGALSAAETRQLNRMLLGRGIRPVAGFASRTVRLSEDDGMVLGRLTGFSPLYPVAHEAFDVAAVAAPEARETMMQQLVCRILTGLGRSVVDLEANAAGLEMVAVGDMATAEAHFRAALAANPAFAAPRHNLSVLLWARLEWAEAEQAAREAVRLAPAVAAYRYQLGRVLLDAGNREAAAPELLKAAREGGFLPALHELGKLHLEQGAYGEAQWAFGRCLEAAPGFAPARNNLGRVHVALGRYEEAAACFARALADAGADREVRADILVRQMHLYALTEASDKLCAAAAAFFEDREAATAQQRQEALSLNDTAECGAAPSFSDTPRAVVAEVHGRVWWQPDGVRRPVYPRMTLSAGTLQAGAEGRVVLVADDDRVAVVRGPEDVAVDAALFAADNRRVPGFFAATLAGPDTAATLMSRALVVPSKGDEVPLHVWAPRGADGGRPDLLWSGAASGTFHLEVGRRFGKSLRKVVPADHPDLQRIDLGFLEVYRLPWPWPDTTLPPGAAWRFRVRVPEATGADAAAPFVVREAPVLTASLPWTAAAFRLRSEGMTGRYLCLLTARIEAGEQAADVLALARALFAAAAPHPALAAFERVAVTGDRPLKTAAYRDMAVVHDALGAGHEADAARARDTAAALARLAGMVGANETSR